MNACSIVLRKEKSGVCHGGGTLGSVPSILSNLRARDGHGENGADTECMAPSGIRGACSRLDVASTPTPEKFRAGPTLEQPSARPTVKKICPRGDII